MMSAFNILAAGYSQRQLLNVLIIMCYLGPKIGFTTAIIFTHVKHPKCVCPPTLRLGKFKHMGKQYVILHFWETRSLGIFTLKFICALFYEKADGMN